MNSLSLNDLDRLTGELASFARSDVPLPEGLAQLEATLPHGKLKNLAGQTAEATRQGKPLSEALASANVGVPESFIALVHCGEISGDLDGVLDFAMKHGRRLKQHHSSTATILIYPILVIMVLFFIMWFTSALVIPRFRDIYDMLGAELPGPTQIIISVSNLMGGSFGALIAILAIGFGLYLLIAATTDRIPTRLLDLLPGVKQLIYLGDTAVMTEFLGHLLAHGVPLPDACRAASLVVNHADMRSSLEEMAKASELGGASADLLSPRVPATAAWLYRQGEERGTLADACAGIAHYCESRFDLLSRRTLYLMEPLLIFIIAMLCGFMVIALYLPLFNIPKIVGS